MGFDGLDGFKGDCVENRSLCAGSLRGLRICGD